MKVIELVIMMLVFSGAVIGLTSFYTETATSYGADTSDISFVNVTQNITSKTDEMKAKLDKGESDITAFVDIIVTGVFESVKILFSVPAVFSGLATDTTEASGLIVPGWFISLLIIIVTIIVLFAIIKQVTKVDV